MKEREQISEYIYSALEIALHTFKAFKECDP